MWNVFEFCSLDIYDAKIYNRVKTTLFVGKELKKFHSTASVLLDSTNEWFVNMDRGFFNIAVFLDLQKVFDTIDHDILLKKLDPYGLEKSALNLLNHIDDEITGYFQPNNHTVVHTILFRKLYLQQEE